MNFLAMLIGRCVQRRLKIGVPFRQFLDGNPLLEPVSLILKLRGLGSYSLDVSNFHLEGRSRGPSTSIQFGDLVLRGHLIVQCDCFQSDERKTVFAF